MNILSIVDQLEETKKRVGGEGFYKRLEMLLENHEAEEWLRERYSDKMIDSMMAASPDMNAIELKKEIEKAGF